MDYHYHASQFYSGPPTPDCLGTVQWQVNNEADWTTFSTIYGDRAGRWVFTPPTPLQPGPDTLPLPYPTVVTLPATGDGRMLVPTQTSAGGPVLDPVSVYLLRSEGGGLKRIIGQGQSLAGAIELIGVRPGDVVKALDWNGVWQGEMVVGSDAVLTLEPAPWNPTLLVTPISSGNAPPNQPDLALRGVQITLTPDRVLDGPPIATLVELGTGAMRTLPLAAGPGGVFTAAFTPAPREGFVFITAQADNGATQLWTITDYDAGCHDPASRRWAHTPRISGDGMTEVHLPRTNVMGACFAVARAQGAPDPRAMSLAMQNESEQVIGIPYVVTAATRSGPIPVSALPYSVVLSYDLHELRQRAIDEASLALRHRQVPLQRPGTQTGQWRRLATTLQLDEHNERRFVAALAPVALQASAEYFALVGTTRQQVNLLANPSFEVDANQDHLPDEWLPLRQGGALLARGEGGHWSPHNLHIELQEPGAAGVEQSVGVVAGEVYRFHGWVSLPEVDDQVLAVLLVEAINANQGVVQSWEVAKFASRTGGWLPVDATLTMPEGTAWMRVRFVATGSRATVLLDDLVLDGPGQTHLRPAGRGQGR